MTPYAEAEVIALAARSLEQLSPKYVLALSDVSFVGSLLDQMGLSAPVRGRCWASLPERTSQACASWRAGELTGEQADGLRELVELYAPLQGGDWPGGAAGQEQRRLGRPCGSSPSPPDCWSRLGWRSRCGWISPW